VPAGTGIDPESRRWLEGLHRDSPRHDETVARLRELLLRVARHELGRRRAQLGAISGPELDDLAQQSANDAVVTILDRVDAFRGASRFTTWAYKFAIFAVSGNIARHAWRRHPPDTADVEWERLPDTLAPRPGEQVERQEQLAALSAAVAGALTDRQREVFVAVALNDVAIDVVALRLGSNRNAVYKNLFDARRRLRASLAAAGHPLTPEEAVA
jgi:RNA polymerase sigma-70 factor (ECF subfamily)